MLEKEKVNEINIGVDLKHYYLIDLGGFHLFILLYLLIINVMPESPTKIVQLMNINIVLLVLICLIPFFLFYVIIFWYKVHLFVNKKGKRARIAENTRYTYENLLLIKTKKDRNSKKSFIIPFLQVEVPWIVFLFNFSISTIYIITSIIILGIIMLFLIPGIVAFTRFQALQYESTQELAINAITSEESLLLLAPIFPFITLLGLNPMPFLFLLLLKYPLRYFIFKKRNLKKFYENWKLWKKIVIDRSLIIICTIIFGYVVLYIIFMVIPTF